MDNTTFPTSLTRPPFFCLCEKHNTHIILTADGWYNSDTEIAYPFDSYTGRHYDELALQTPHCRSQLALLGMRSTREDIRVLLTWEAEHPLETEEDCSCYDLPDGRCFVCPVCQAANAEMEIPF